MRLLEWLTEPTHDRLRAEWAGLSNLEKASKLIERAEQDDPRKKLTENLELLTAANTYLLRELIERDP